jgi:hypothetical protein
MSLRLTADWCPDLPEEALYFRTLRTFSDLRQLRSELPPGTGAALPSYSGRQQLMVKMAQTTSKRQKVEPIRSTAD